MRGGEFCAGGPDNKPKDNSRDELRESGAKESGVLGKHKSLLLPTINQRVFRSTVSVILIIFI